MGCRIIEWSSFMSRTQQQAPANKAPNISNSSTATDRSHTSRSSGEAVLDILGFNDMYDPYANPYIGVRAKVSDFDLDENTLNLAVKKSIRKDTKAEIAQVQVNMAKGADGTITVRTKQDLEKAVMNAAQAGKDLKLQMDLYEFPLKHDPKQGWYYDAKQITSYGRASALLISGKTLSAALLVNKLGIDALDGRHGFGLDESVAVRVEQVRKNSPLSVAGLRDDDIISGGVDSKLKETPIWNSKEFVEYVASHRGETVQFKVERKQPKGSQELTISVKIPR